jgi:hypothetical protein
MERFFKVSRLWSVAWPNKEATLRNDGHSPDRRIRENMILSNKEIHSLDLLDGAAESWRNRTPFGKGLATWISGKLFLQKEYD